MASAETKLVLYTGKQRNRDDDVVKGSGRAWAGGGYAVAVPVSQVGHYLKFPSIFRVVTDAEYKKIESAREEALQGLDRVVDVSENLSVEDLKQLRERIDALITLKANNPSATLGDVISAEVILPKTEGLRAEAEDGSLEAQEALAEHVRNVANAIEELDRKDSADWDSAEDRPNPAKLKELTGEDVSEKDIDDALALTADAPKAKASVNKPSGTAKQAAAKKDAAKQAADGAKAALAGKK